MPWATAKVNGTVIAETEFPQLVHGDVYFPMNCVNWEYFSPDPENLESQVNSASVHKGKATYFTLEVNGTTLPDAAWMYSCPSEKNAHVKDHVAFLNYAPLMLKYKKNFHYARSDTSSNVSDTSSICGSSSLSSPASSAPTTPTFAYSTPTLYFNPALYSQPPPSSHYYTPPTFRDKEKLVFGGCLGGSLVNHYHSLHRDRMLSTVPEVDYGSSPGNTGLALVGISEEA